MLAVVQQDGCHVQSTEQRRAEYDAGQNFADYLGLAQPDKQIPEQLRQSNQQQEDEKDGSEIGVRQRSCSPKTRKMMREGSSLY